MNKKKKPKKISFPELIEEYNKLIKETMPLQYFIIDIGIQRNQIKVLRKFKNVVVNVKYQAIQREEEIIANDLFHLQSILNANMSLLDMWVLLKKNKHREAWNKLIDVYDYISFALRAGDNHFGIDDFLSKVENIEKVIFPGFNKYLSIGAIISGGICTVCRKEIDYCEHIEGLVYWGRLCLRVDAKMEGNHVALVDTPRDRRCIIREILLENGYYQDYMTLKKLHKAEENNIDEIDGLKMNVTILKTGLLDIY